MISSEKSEKETFYSPYGYIQVNKSDYESPSQLIKFKKQETSQEQSKYLYTYNIIEKRAI